jgi:OFA family oxalate/formate antiporter-like MFS transporter
MDKNKRWLYLFTAILVLLFMGLIYAWSIFRVPFSALYPDWTGSQISMTFTISMMSFCIAGYVSGLLSHRVSFRMRLVITMTLVFAGFFGVSLMDPSDSHASLVMLYLCYSVVSSFGLGMGYIAIVSTLTGWFPDKIGLASGLLFMGYGLGGLVLGVAANALISAIGLLPTFRVLAFASLLVLMLGVIIIKTPHEVERSANAGGGAGRTGDVRPSDMVRTRDFWWYIAWIILIDSAGLLVVNSAANISLAFGGTAVLGLAVSLFNGFGRIVAGVNFDHKGFVFASCFTVLLLIAAGAVLSLGSASSSLTMVVYGMLLVGMAYGAIPTLTSSYFNSVFGPTWFATNFSIAGFALIPAAFVGPMLSTHLLESAGGAWNTNFYAIFIAGVGALLIWFVLRRVFVRDSRRKTQIKGCEDGVLN